MGFWAGLAIGSISGGVLAYVVLLWRIGGSFKPPQWNRYTDN